MTSCSQEMRSNLTGDRDTLLLLPEDTVKEDNNAGDAWYDQHVREESQPGEVESNLDSVISPHSVQRLELVPVTKPAPLLVELTTV